MTTSRRFVFASFVFTFAMAQAAETAMPAPPPPAAVPAKASAKPTPEKTLALNNPRGIAVDKDGTIYVGDIGDGLVYKMTPDGKLSIFAGGSQKSSDADGLGKEAGFSSPTGLALDKDGNVYVADGDSNTIRKITPAGMVTTIAGKAGEAGTADGKGAVARFTGATGVAADKSGNVFVADTHSGVVRKIAADGTVTTLTHPAPATKPGEAKSSAVELGAPRAIAVDGNGVIYVADEEKGIVCKVAPDGTVTVIAGNPDATTGSTDGVGAKAVIVGPRGLAVDAKGNLYVADTDEGLIRKITPDGTVTTLAGQAGTTGNTDGKGAAAHFAGPRGLAVDKDGNVYVADSDNSAIRKITPDSTVTTLGAAPAKP